MTTKPFLPQVISAVGSTQDGGKLNDDAYSDFLRTIINANVMIGEDQNRVDTEELASNLRYAIAEFGRALKAVDDFNI